MRVKNYIIAVTASIAVMGCSESKSLRDSDQSLLSINTDITSTKGIVLTGTEFSHESQINVIMRGGTDRSNVYTLKKPTAAAGTWLPSNGIGIKLTSTEEDVYAHYPAVLPSGSTFDPTALTLTPSPAGRLNFGTPDTYNADNAFRITFKGDTKPSEVLMAEGEYDYMVGQGANKVSNTAKEVSITMSHCYAIVVVRVVKAPENNNPGVLKQIQFTNNDLGAAPLKYGSFSLIDNTFIPISDIGYRRNMDGFVEGTYFALMVYPASIKDNDVYLTLTIDEGIFLLGVPAKDWQSGKVILYNITLKATSAELNGPVNVYGWDDLEPVNTHNFPLE